MMTSPAVQRKNTRKGSSGQNIKVFVRCRPMNSAENKTLNVVECRNSRELVLKDRPLDKLTRTFTFDRVFGQDSKQIDVYKAVAKNSVAEVLSGFNCTIFAYGQTGTGKTFTMEGERTPDNCSWDEDPLAGIIPRCVTHLFDELRVQNMEFSMRVSFLELYNEELFDLLSAHDDLSKLRLYEDASRKGSCIIQGLEEVLVRTKSDVYSILEKGSAKRQTAATLMNAHSSRSHTVFTVTVHIKENTVDGDELLKTGKLHLVDLAGSENIGRSGAVDKRAREAGNINMSLLTLGRVITSLVEKAPHIPYRESKLTRLLQDALGGRTKTSIIATISPSAINLEETVSTLEYAHRAKNIQNKPEVNQKLNKKELIGEYSHEIERLRRDLMAMREKNGVYLAPENYQEMMTRIDVQDQEIAEKITHIRVLEEDKEKKLELFTEMTKQLEEKSQQLEETEGQLTTTQVTLVCTQKLLTDTAQEREEEKVLVKAHSKTEKKLKEEGRNLINVVGMTSTDIYKLHDKLDRKRAVEDKNLEVTGHFQQEYINALEDIRTDLSNTLTAKEEAIRNNTTHFGGSVKKCLSQVGDVKDQLSSIRQEQADIVNMIFTLYKTNIENQSGHNLSMKKLVSEGAESQLSTMKCFVDGEALPSLDQLATLISSHDQTLATLQNSLTDSLNTIEGECESFEKSQSSSLIELKREIENSVEKHVQHAQACDAALTASRDSTASFTKEITIKLNSLMESLKSAQDVVDTHDQKTSTNVTKALETTQDLAGQAKEAGTRAGQLTGCVQEEQGKHFGVLRSHKVKAQDKLQDTVNELENNVRCVGEQRCGLESAVGRYSNTAHQAASDTTAALSKLHKEREEAAAKELEEHSAVIETKREALNHSLKLQQEALEAEMLTLEADRLRLEKECETHLSGLREWFAQHDSQLQTQATQVMRLINDDMVKDVPTGQTPARREYNYSQLLSSTSPHDRILRRFRAASATTLSKIPLPSFGDEDDDLASPTTNSSQLSCSSASSSCNTSQLDDDSATDVRSRAGSLSSSTKTSSQKFLVPDPPLQREDSGISRSSSTTALNDSKENRVSRQNSFKKRELKPPTVFKSASTEKLSTGSETQTRPRRILGSQN